MEMVAVAVTTKVTGVESPLTTVGICKISSLPILSMEEDLLMTLCTHSLKMRKSKSHIEKHDIHL